MASPKIVVVLNTREELEMVDLTVEDTFVDLKKKLFDREGIIPERQRLYYQETFPIDNDLDKTKIKDGIMFLQTWVLSAFEDEGENPARELPPVIRIRAEFPIGGGGSGKTEPVTFETKDDAATIIRLTGLKIRRDFEALPIEADSNGVVKLEKDFWRQTVKFGLVFRHHEINRGDQGEFFVYHAHMYRVKPGSNIKIVKEEHIWRAYLKEKTENCEEETLLRPTNTKEFDQTRVISRLQLAKLATSPAKAVGAVAGAL